MADMHEPARWARGYRTMLVFAEGPGGMLTLDFRNPLDPIAEIMVTLLAFCGADGSASHPGEGAGLKPSEACRYGEGGSCPTPLHAGAHAPMPDGAGKTLVPDPDAVKVVEKIIRYLLEDGNANPTSIAVALHSGKSRIPSSRDHWANKQGRENGGKTGGRQAVDMAVLA